MRPIDLLKCPVCGDTVLSDGKSLFCTGEKRRHVFDFASSGYVNLLDPGKAKNAKSGDDKAMIASRARFLDCGYYDSFSKRIGELVAGFSVESGKGNVTLADMACGEGHHTLNIVNTVERSGVKIVALGFDASKHGAAKGAKRAAAEGKGNVLFAAANIFSLPVKDSSLDFATSIFAPVAWSEAARCLKDDGVLIVASSGENHLFELREALYDTPRRASGNVSAPEDFTLLSEETVSYRVRVEGKESVADLFAMTPFAYKTSRQDAEKLSMIDALDITVEVKLSAYSKCSDRRGSL